MINKILKDIFYSMKVFSAELFFINDIWTKSNLLHFVEHNSRHVEVSKSVSQGVSTTTSVSVEGKVNNSAYFRNSYDRSHHKEVKNNQCHLGKIIFRTPFIARELISLNNYLKAIGKNLIVQLQMDKEYKQGIPRIRSTGSSAKY